MAREPAARRRAVRIARGGKRAAARERQAFARERQAVARERRAVGREPAARHRAVRIARGGKRAVAMKRGALRARVLRAPVLRAPERGAGAGARPPPRAGRSTASSTLSSGARASSGARCCAPGAATGPPIRRETGNLPISMWVRSLLRMFAFAAALVPLGELGAAPLRFELEVSPDVGTLTDTFTATVRIEVAGLAGPDRFWDPDFGDFKVLDTQTKTSNSSQIDPQRGQQLKVTEIRRYTLQPRRYGSLLIGPARVLIDGEDFETRRARVRVTKERNDVPASAMDDLDPTAGFEGGVPGFVPPDPSRGSEDLFLYAVADKSEVYVGEQVTVTWLLYANAEVLKFEPRPPPLSGFWSEIVYEADSFFTYHDTLVGRVPFTVAMISKRALFAAEPGMVRIRPFQADVTTLETPTGRSKSLRSQPLRVRVKPLPAGAPEGFDPSYVGRFEAEAVVDRMRIHAADALTLSLTIRGSGAIRRTSPPALNVSGFAFETPRDYEEEVAFEGNRATGERTYRYWATPQRAGVQAIPAILVPYFDPELATYEVARTRPIAVEVVGDPASVGTEDERAPTKPIGRDIRLIHLDGSPASPRHSRLLGGAWFWLLALLPPALYILIVGADRLRRRLAQETPRGRLRRARGRARQRFRVADIHLRGQRPAKFFGELSRVISEHIEERVGQPIQSMTRDEMRAFLGKRGFDGTTIKQIEDSLETFDFARFAPSAAEDLEMRTALRRTKELLKRIESMPLGGGER